MELAVVLGELRHVARAVHPIAQFSRFGHTRVGQRLECAGCKHRFQDHAQFVNLVRILKAERTNGRSFVRLNLDESFSLESPQRFSDRSDTDAMLHGYVALDDPPSGSKLAGHYCGAQRVVDEFFRRGRPTDLICPGVTGHWLFRLVLNRGCIIAHRVHRIQR